MTLIRSLSRHLRSGDLDELTLTANGTQLAKHADALAAAGIKRINVSLDTLRPETFKGITRWGKLDNVLCGLAAEKEAASTMPSSLADRKSRASRNTGEK